MPRLVAEETHDSSGPVEATVGSSPVGASLLASLGPHSESILRPAFLPHNCVNVAQLGRLLFVHFAHVFGLFLLGRPLNASDMKAFFFLPIINDALNLPGCLN
jgi:hypothetical protein